MRIELRKPGGILNRSGRQVKSSLHQLPWCLFLALPCSACYLVVVNFGDRLRKVAGVVAIVVQKFGGTSVATPEKILAAAQRVVRTMRAGNQVVVVVSARGLKTDELIDLAHAITDNPPAREMDMLLSTGEQESVALLDRKSVV